MLPITNFSQSTQWLEKGTVLGSAETIDAIDDRPVEPDDCSYRTDIGGLNFNPQVSERLTREQKEEVLKLLKTSLSKVLIAL